VTVERQLPIGAVAARAGVGVTALRFYEDRGLIASIRSGGGHRQYPRGVLRRLAFIQVAQRVGLSLEDIGLASPPCPRKARRPGIGRGSRQHGGPALDDRIRILEGLRDQLDSCIGCGCLSLEHCRLSNPGPRQRCRCGSPLLARRQPERLIGRARPSAQPWPGNASVTY